MYRLAINHNPLESIHEEAFYGLDNTLWELELRFDKLTSVPSRSLRYLQKLRLLDLAGEFETYCVRNKVHFFVHGS